MAMQPGLLRAVVTPNANYSQIENGTFNNDAARLIEAAAGGTQPLFAGVTQLTPTFSGNVSKLATLFTECPLPWGKALTTGNTDLYLAPLDNLGTRKAGNYYQRFRCASNVCMYWGSVSVQQGQVARANVMWHPVWLGGDAPAPVVAAGTAAAPTSGGADEYFGLSKVVVNGTALDGVTGWTLSTNIQRDVMFTDGAIYPKFSATMGVAPQLRINTTDMGVWSAYGTGGTALTSLEVYLQRYYPNSAGYYGVGESQHIKFSASSGLIVVDSISGGRQRAENQVTINLVGEDESTDVLEVAVGQTIA